MKKLFLAAIPLALSAAGALAADLPSKRPPPPPFVAPPPPPMMWTGLHIGVNAGYNLSVSPYVAPSQSNTMLENAVPGVAFIQDALETPIAMTQAAGAGGAVAARTDGFEAGGQIGYDFQIGTRLVAGVEADIEGIFNASGTGRRSSVLDVPGGGGLQVATIQQATRSLDYFGTLRARIGVLATPALLVYGTGGLAYGGVKESYSVIQNLIVPPGGLFASQAWTGGSASSGLRYGWTAGAGLEWMFAPNWSAKFEYLYYSLGTARTRTFAMLDPTGFNGPAWLNYTNARTRFDGHMARAGLNYHFGGGVAPVWSKY